MAKKEEKVNSVQASELSQEEAADREKRGLVVPADFEDIEVVGPNEDVDVADVLLALVDPTTGEVGNPAEWEAHIVASDYFWPAARGLAIVGMLLGVESRMTGLAVKGELQLARFYSVELTRPCIAIRSRDLVPGQPLPKPVVCSPGHVVSVLERTLLRRLEDDIGREVIVVCDGKGKTKKGLDLWRYRSWRKKVVQVVSESVLHEQKQLPAAPEA